MIRAAEIRFSNKNVVTKTGNDHKPPQTSTNDHKLPANDYKLPGNDHKIPTNDHKLPVNDKKRPPLHIKPKS